jgi:hypothetical protein
MFRLLGIQAILGILLCPYHCVAKQALLRARADHAVASGCCEQCRCRQQAETAIPAEAPGDSEPLDPCEDGRSCICEGAVFDAPGKGPAAPLLEFAHFAAAIDSAIAGAQSPPTAPARDLRHAPPWESGQQIRIATQSFLI